MAERTRSAAGAAAVCSAKTKYKYNTNFNKNGFCCKSNFKTGTGLKQFTGNMAYRGGMIIYIFALMLLSLRCCWFGRTDGVARGSFVVFAAVESSSCILKYPEQCQLLPGHAL